MQVWYTNVIEQQTKPAHACSPMIPYYQNQLKLAVILYSCFTKVLTGMTVAGKDV